MSFIDAIKNTIGATEKEKRELSCIIAGEELPQAVVDKNVFATTKGEKTKVAMMAIFKGMKEYEEDIQYPLFCVPIKTMIDGETEGDSVMCFLSKV